MPLNFSRRDHRTSAELTRAGQAARQQVATTSELFMRRFVDIWLLFGLGLWWLLYLKLPAHQYPGPLMLLAAASAKWAMLSGRMRLARHLIVLAWSGFVLLMPLLLNGVRSPLLLFMPPLLMMAGWMLGRRALGWLAVLYTCGVLFYWLAEAGGLLAPELPTRSAVTWMVVLMLAVACTGCLVRALVGNYEASYGLEMDLQRQLAEALARAEKANRELAAVLKFNATILLNSPLPIGVYATDGRCVEANEAFAQLVGASREALLEQNFHQLESWRASGLLEQVLHALADDQPRQLEADLVTSFGRAISVEASIQVTQLNGERHVLLQLFDLGQRKQIELRLRDALAEGRRLRDAMETVSAYIYIKDCAGRYLYVNNKVCELFGCAAAAIVGQTDERFFNLSLSDDLRRNDRRVLGHGERIESEEVNYIGATGEKRYYWTVKSPILDGEGAISGMCGISTDITEFKRVEEELKRTRGAAELANRELTAVLKFNESILLHSPLPMRVFGADGRCIEANEAFARLVGAGRIELLGQSAYEASLWHVQALADDCSQAQITHCVQRREVQVGTRGGRDIWLEARIVPLEANGGSHLLAQFVDLTERKRLEQELRLLAFYDALTQLPNRRLLLDRLKQAVHASKRRASYAAVLFLDLDKFKLLNDTHGHDAGDQLLVGVARRLRALVRQADTVARLGGDEFVLLLENLGPDPVAAQAHVDAVAEKVAHTLGHEYQLGELRYFCSVSIGTCLFDGQLHDPDEILKRADGAMYRVKRGGAG